MKFSKNFIFFCFTRLKSYELLQFYPPDEDGSVPVAYLWARTVKCPNPACGATIPLVKQLWLCKRNNNKVAMRMIPNQKDKKCDFEIIRGKEIDFNPDNGTMQRGDTTCPHCHTVASVQYLRDESCGERLGQQLMAVVNVKPDIQGKQYRSNRKDDLEVFRQAGEKLKELKARYGDNIVPDEPIIKNARGQISPPIWGLDQWGKLFNDRQTLALISFVINIQKATEFISNTSDTDRAKAVCSCLTLAIGRLSDYCSNLCLWGMDFIAHTFGRQALPMVWDYAEGVPIYDTTGNWAGALDWITRVLDKIGGIGKSGIVKQASATKLPMSDSEVHCTVTDPPYYDAVPYSDLSDFFYVWHKRVLSRLHPNIYRTPLTPKSQEIIQAAQRHGGDRKVAAQAYERMMEQAFTEVYRTVNCEGIVAVMFAHKETTAWETTMSALMNSGLLVTGSWPIHTERPGRMVANNTAALASSVTLICRKRAENAGEGFWDDVRQELRKVANERLDFFWEQGIRGADFFISAIGPALSVFGRYEKVKRLSGEEVSIKDFLLEVRELVSNYALSKILGSGQKGHIDAESQFYVVWKWSYDDTKVPAGESFILAQALGLDTEVMWDRTGTLEKSGQNVQALSIAKRMQISNLGEPESDGSPASMIDTLHRMCSFRDKGDSDALAEFLARSGHARNETLWVVAQAVSEILPDGDKEKQLLQGLLNQRDNLQELTRDAKLF